MSETNKTNAGQDAEGLTDDPGASIFPESKVIGTAASDRVRESDTLSVWKTNSGAGEINMPKNGAAFRLIRRIGRGGMGEVWEAVQVSLNRAVAVKRVVTHGKASDSTAARTRDFMMEALVSARLEHPNIVPVHDLGRDEAGAPLLAMKLVKGASWETRIREEFETLPPEQFLSRHIPTLIAVAQAVAFAHSRGVVHRDIKPSQVMLGDYGEVLLMDWGLAVVLDDLPGDMISHEVLIDDEALTEDSIYPTRELASMPGGHTRDDGAGTDRIDVAKHRHLDGYLSAGLDALLFDHGDDAARRTVHDGGDGTGGVGNRPGSIQARSGSVHSKRVGRLVSEVDASESIGTHGDGTRFHFAVTRPSRWRVEQAEVGEHHAGSRQGVGKAEQRL
jgi:serine/threonine protein kinase